VGHVSRCSGLLRIEESRARVSQSGLKTGRGATMGGARGTIDATGCVGPCYPCLAIFYVLGPRCILVF
jgi:hypothetical protein